MKKLISYLPVAILSMGLFFTSCKKEKTVETDNTSEYKDQTDDDARFANETDAVADDATAALESMGGSYVGGRPMTPSPLPLRCDATVVIDTTSLVKTITITYSGDTCVGNRRSRTGTVVLSFARDFRWANAGAQYTVSYQNLRVTRRNDNKTITINGTKTIKNVSGGKLRDLATRTTPIVHEVTSSNMNVTFDNGTQRSWQVARRRTFTYNSGVVISVTGFGNNSNVAEWGTNRAGNAFTTAVTEPLVFKQSCDYRLVSGQVQHTGRLTTTTTFGLDATGNPVSDCPAGPFYYKVVWVGPAGTAYTFIGAY